MVVPLLVEVVVSPLVEVVVEVEEVVVIPVVVMADVVSVVMAVLVVDCDVVWVVVVVFDPLTNVTRTENPTPLIPSPLECSRRESVLPMEVMVCGGPNGSWLQYLPTWFKVASVLPW